MLYFRVGSLPEMKQLPEQARQSMLRRHIGPRFYCTLVGKSGILGALVYAILYFGLPRFLSERPAHLTSLALGAGILAGFIRYSWLMSDFRKQLIQTIRRGW